MIISICAVCKSTKFVAPALERCDIGVRFSVRPSFHPQITSTLAFKSIQMTNSDQTPSLRIVKYSLVENSRWPPLLKIAKLLKSQFCLSFHQYVLNALLHCKINSSIL